MTEKDDGVCLSSLLKVENTHLDPDNAWKDLCPELNISEALVKASGATPELHNTEEASAVRRHKLANDGYALVDDVSNAPLISNLKQGIESLERAGLPPTLILLFDEAWELARLSSETMARCTDSGNSFNFDLLAWFIKPGMAGFSPHRDRQPEDLAASFYKNGQPKFVTHWIALSEATPSNSCLHMIPKPMDPGYLGGDGDDMDPMQRALPNKEAYQRLRALPRSPGQSVLFSHRIIHWGSKSDADAKCPRIAISFVCSNPEYEPPLVDPSHFNETQNPPLRIRLLLVCAQLLIYYQRFDLDKALVKACYDFCKKYEADLDKIYRQKVFVEFVKAMKEQDNPEAKYEPGTDDLKESNVQLILTTKEDEDEEDAMMEEMLNAEDEGYGEFQDDFDELEDGSVNSKDPNPSGEDDEDEDSELIGLTPFAIDVDEEHVNKKRKAS